MDRIVITGGNGFIGRHLVQKLLSTNTNSIVVISNNSNVSPEREIIQDQRLTYYTVDIRDNNRISQVMKDENPNTCIHLAAKTSVVESIKNPDETMAINVKGTENVLNACSKIQVRNFIFASSAAVYGDVTKLPISEKHSLHPLSPYGISKMLAEKQVWTYGKFNEIQNSVSLRFFNVYGAGQSSGSDVVTKFAKRLSKGLAPIICGNGSHTRDFVSVDDVTDAILLSLSAMENNYDNYEGFSSPAVFNVGTGVPTNIFELAKKMIDIFGLDLHPIYQDGKIDDGVILHSYADMKKAREVLHFVHKKSIDVGLTELIEQIGFRK